jgi:hypothetical protein
VPNLRQSEKGGTENFPYLLLMLKSKFCNGNLPKKFNEPVDWSARHADSCGIAAAELRPRRRYDEEAQRRPAESEVPGTEINSPIHKIILVY